MAEYEALKAEIDDLQEEVGMSISKQGSGR
jgi:hypothetical protein